MLRLLAGCVASALLLGGCQTSVDGDEMLYRMQRNHDAAIMTAG